MTHHSSDALSGYIDGDLDAAQVREIAGHLAGCAECRAIVADLERVRAEACAWAAETAMPSSDLWAGIATRLTPRATADTQAAGAPAHIAPVNIAWYRRRWSFGLPELALAASLVAALGGALVYQRASAPAPVQETVPVLAEAEPIDAPDAGVVSVNFADTQYNAAVSDLERVLQEQRDRLNPRTVLVLERNLRIIDEAVREARAALAADPANPLLNAQLADVRRRKLQLLRRAALITEGD